MKTSKRIISLVLCAVMVATTFLGAGLASLVTAEAAITLGGITQQRVVDQSVYASYQAKYFTGSDSNEPTNFVIPGLSSSNDYTPQGMTYWEEKEWILISAYDASGSKKNSVIYAIDAVTTEFVALFRIFNADGSVNTSHGGGIAASKYNFYYADSDSKISYFPLSEMDVPKNTVKDIKLVASINCAGELNSAKTSYCCYEDGILWAGNFYYDSSDYDYGQPAHSQSNSMIVGYELHGNSSAEEWYYLSTNYNRIKLNQDSTNDITSGAMTFKTFNTDGANVEIRGKITTEAALGEVTYNFCSMTLTEGVKYKVEFIADNNLSDLYFFAPNGTHCNVKQSQASKITNLGNGKYHYQMIFTAGLKPTGADSSWPTTQSTNGTYTGTYTMRFDQDSVPAGGRTFNMTDISVTEYVEPNGFTPDSKYEGVGCAGNPTHVIGIAGIDKIQYAMVFKGKIYISRSWKRVEGTNHTRELMIGDIDISSPGTSNLSINGRTRPCHMLTLSNMTRFGGDNGSSNLGQMLYMGEALCVMDDYLYMFGEGAAWTYNGKESSKCTEPIDVIWKIDQHAIMGESRSYDDTAASHYEKVDSLSEITMTDDYIIVHESSVKDPVTQRNILYAIDAFGGYGNNKLPKQDAGTQANSGDSMGIVGYPISNYSIDTDEEGNTIIHVPEEVDTTKSLHWQIQGANTTNLRINNKDLYYATNNHLYFGSRLFAMTTDARTNLDLITLTQYNNQAGDFRLSYNGANGTYYLWCNDGSDQGLIDTYTNYYSNHGKSGYVPQYHGLEEVAGTFHGDATMGQNAANSGNLKGSDVGIDMQIIHIYKRVADPYSSAYETRVYTDLGAELKSDGTYDITLETYAISELQYQNVKKRPTDFIFVLDASGSMDNGKHNDCSGYIRYGESNTLSSYSIAGTDDVVKKDNQYKEYSGGNIYYRHSDGTFCLVKCMSQYVRKSGLTTYTRIKVWYTYGNQNYYMMSNGSIQTTEPAWEDCIQVSANTVGTRADRTVYTGVHYRYSGNGDIPRLDAMKNAVVGLTYKIQNEVAAKPELDHRIAVVTFGSDSSESYLNTGMYTNSSTSIVGYSSLSDSTYKNAFYNAANFDSVRYIVDHIVCNSGDPDTFSNYGLEMANNIVSKSGENYLADGDRSVCIVFITDGVPGIGNNDLSSANTAAAGAIQNAYKAKHNGAYIYSVRIGEDSMSGFDMNNYMDYVSSEFVYAESMNTPGDRNIKEIDYHIDVPTGSSFNINQIANEVFESVTSNSTNAIATLDAESILYEHLTDAFILDNATVTYQTAKGAYDGLGRLYFEAPQNASGFTTSIDKTENVITVKGFDYSTKYVAKSNVGKGEKLIVTISGVIANADAELLNTSINVVEEGEDPTALYQDETMMSKDLPVKEFPTEYFTIPEYTYVMDYDIPMYDNDINGTLCSVDSTLQKQSTYKTVLNTENMGVEFTNNNLDMIYTLNSQGDSSDEKRSKGYVLIKRDDGTYDWFRLNIIPASNVYYEESSLETIANSNYVKWTQNGTSDRRQQLSAITDVYGNDPAYTSCTEDFSLGTHLEATVSASNKRSETKTFTFTGTGFDLYSACGPNTGMQTVTVRKHATDAKGNLVTDDNGNPVTETPKVYIVDTYYNDANYSTITQVPIIHFTGARGTYTVEITAAYYAFAGALKHNTVSTNAVEGTDIEASSAQADVVTTDELFAQVGMDELIGQNVEFIWMDENSVLNGGTGVEGSTLMTQAEGTTNVSLVNYIDGFRIYNPLKDDSDYPYSEKGAAYYNVIDAITAGNADGTSLAAYIEPGATGDINFGNYLTSGGPKHEVYLAPGNAIAFRFKADYAADAAPRAMVSIRAASGSPKVKFGVTNTTNVWTFDVNSRSETFYHITDYLGVDSEGYFTLTVENTGSGLLAVNNLKTTNATLVPLTTANLSEINQLMTMAATEVDPALLSVAKAENKYPDYVAPEPGTGVDLTLDADGVIPDYVAPEETPEETPDEPTDKYAEIAQAIEDFFGKILAFFEKILVYIKNLFPIF